MTAAFLQHRAERLIELNDLVAAKKEPFSARYLDLMTHPKKRNEQIMADAIGYMSERYAEETDDDEAAAGYAADLASFVIQPWEAIASIPLPVRGDLHSTGAALVSEVCRLQAWLEIVAPDALGIGDQMGLANKAAATRMSTPEKKKMARDGGLEKSLQAIAAKDKKKPDAG